MFPSAPFWDMQESWTKIFSFVPRITVASWTAFLVSENLDAYIFDWFKKFTRGKHLWARNALSSLPSLAIDSFIFIPLAFYGGSLPLLPLILGQIVIKWMVGIVNIPFMYLNKIIMQKQDDGASPKELPKVSEKNKNYTSSTRKDFRPK